jgi:ubiquinone/menaquinone biosynthesis C-methylase UbiE
MPYASRHTASETVATNGLDVRIEHLQGGYSVCFESHRADADLASLFRGLPDDRCQLPRWGYVLSGRVTFRFADHEETYAAGDAYYVPPGHTPIHHAGAELVEFSPTDVLQQTIPVVMANLSQATQSENGETAPAHNPTRSAWDRITEGYDRTNTPSQMWLGSESLRRAGLRPGMRFLDVAAGSGALSLPAARLGARVVAIDLSPAMLDRLERRARDEALSVETRVMDGHALAFDDDSFDIAGSQFGVMLFPDMPKGIRELARVVKPGGRVLMTVYGDPHEIEFLSFFVAAVKTVVPTFQGPPMDPLPLPFQLHDRERLRSELTGAGLTRVAVETITEPTEFTSGSHLWDWLLHSNPIVAEILAALDLDAGETALVRQALDGLVRERAGARGAAILTAPINIGIATK